MLVTALPQTIAVRWSLSGGNGAIDVEVPEGAVADLVLPRPEQVLVSEQLVRTWQS
jgi:hypothetical protein